MVHPSVGVPRVGIFDQSLDTVWPGKGYVRLAIKQAGLTACLACLISKYLVKSTPLSYKRKA